MSLSFTGNTTKSHHEQAPLLLRFVGRGIALSAAQDRGPLNEFHLHGARFCRRLCLSDSSASI